MDWTLVKFHTWLIDAWPPLKFCIDIYGAKRMIHLKFGVKCLNYYSMDFGQL